MEVQHLKENEFSAIKYKSLTIAKLGGWNFYYFRELKILNIERYNISRSESSERESTFRIIVMFARVSQGNFNPLRATIVPSFFGGSIITVRSSSPLAK
jgi:hypothetical protein